MQFSGQVCVKQMKASCHYVITCPPYCICITGLISAQKISVNRCNYFQHIESLLPFVGFTFSLRLLEALTLLIVQRETPRLSETY